MSNTNTLGFPNLFSGEWEINRVAFSIFGLNIYWYGICITIGVILAVAYALKNAKRYGVIADKVYDTAFVGGIFGIIGARAYYVIFHNLNPDSTFHYTLKSAIFNIRDGGLAIYGGIILSVLAAFIYAKIRHIRLLPILDLAGIGFLIGQGIGRWGNFFNQEAFGAPTAGDLPWGMTGSAIRSNIDVMLAQYQLPEGKLALVHPCFLYEFVWCAIGVVLLHFFGRKLRRFDGEVFLLYIAWYGLGRFFIESLRMDSLYAGQFRVSQVVALLSTAVALALLFLFRSRVKKSATYRMACNDPECIREIENYPLQQKIREEQRAAKKALRLANKEQGQYESILGDDSEKGE